MSDLHLIEKVQEVSNSRTLNTSSFVQHHIEKKLIRSIGNLNTNGASLNTTTATSSSSAKFSVTSTTEGKSVVSSLSMSLERKDSIQYIPRKIAPCVMPAGQNTVIHLDNYAHFMAQRFTTTKAAIKREEIITEGRPNQIIVPAPTSNASKCSGIADVNLKVLSGGVTSYHNNKKDIVMNKQKLLDQKSLKMRGRKNSLALELKLPKEIKKVNNLMADKIVTTPILKKPKINRRKKVIKPRSSKKIKTKTGVDQDNINKEELEKSQILPIKLSPNTSQELRPCMFTLQRKKCLSEMTCPYLHSDFPCKYYYLNLICPQGFKCQFMHNGPLEPKLIEALRNHILDLLSTKPSSVETLFVQQIHNIEDLAQRLQSFQTNQVENHEVIEVVDDEDDEQQLVIDESSNEIKTHNLPNTMSINSIFNISQENDQTLTHQPTEDKLDLVYENFKDTNTIIDEIDQKLKNIKSTSNMTTNERINQLQNIYQLIKEQEKRLPIYKHFSTATTTKQILTNYDNSQNSSNSLPTIQSEEPHIVLVNPDIINEIRISDSQENAVMSISDDENTMTTADNDRIQLTNLNIPQESDIEYPTIEELAPQGGIEILTTTHSQQQATDNNNENMSLPKESDINGFNISSNFDYEAEPKTCLDTILDNSHLNKNNYEDPKENNEYFQNPNKKISYENEEILAKNNSQISDKTENVEEQNEFNNSLLPPNETLELEIRNDEKEVIESHVEMQLLNEDDVEEQSPSYEHITTAKPKERSRLRLRSHTLQNNEEVSNKANTNVNPVTSLETKKPIRNRRLRLPKPSPKTIEKSNNEKFEINGKIINKPSQSTENTVENTENKEKPVIQDVEVPLTQNVIVTKRFLKRVKAKQSLINEETNKNSTLDANVEQNIMALHCEDHDNINSIENINVTLLTQTSDDTNSFNLSQDPLILESDSESVEKINNEIISGQCFDNGKISNKIKRNTSSNNLNLPTVTEKWEAAKKPNLKRRISFENPLSSLVNTTSVKEQFSLGNPHVVLAKLKPPFLQPSSQKELLADNSTTTNVNPIVTSPLLADDKPAQKRHSFTSEYDFDSSLKENKCLKIDNNSKSIRRVKIDNRTRTNSQQSSDSKDGDFDIDSCDEKLTLVDVIQISSPSTGREQKTAFEPFSTHVKTNQKQQQYSHFHQHVHKEQQENESDLTQQIENISSKSDLQLQTQHQQRFVEREEVGGTTTTTATSFITKNSNNIPNEQHQLKEEEESQIKLVCQKQYENNKKIEVKIANTCNPYDGSKKIEDGRAQFSAFERIYNEKEATSNSSNKYSNETTLKEKEINDEYSTYSSLYNKLSAHSKKCQINFENSSVNITPISSPTYNDDTIASPSPVRKLIDFRMGGEIDGRLTNPPMPYILHEIDLGRIQPYKTISVNKLKTTIQMDPRMLRTYVKKQLTSTSTALVPITSSSNNLSHHFGGSSSSHAQPTTTLEISPYDPRNRASAVMRDIATPSLSHHHETAITPYNNINVAAAASTLPSSLMYTVMPNAVPLSLQYNSSAQPIIQPQQQQTPNMFLYGCLQRSPWYQGLMSTMKIQINQSISQLVRALNNFHRERLLSPEMVFDVFKIDCAGELLEIMRNLGIFVDANGIINEQRKVPSFGGRSCCNSMPVNATYSFIQQVLTPNTQCTSLTTASSTYNAAGGTPVGQLNANEPFVSCYIKAPEQPTQKQSDDNNNTFSNHSQHDDNSGNRRCNGNCNSNRNDNFNNNNNNYNNKRFGSQYKKPYDNNNGNSNYQQRSNQRSSYNNSNPRFNKPGSGSPNRSNSSPPNSPRNGGGGGRGGGGRFNNNRRFNNNDNNYNNNGSSWSSSSGSNGNRFNNKYQNNNSPTRNSSPKSSFQTGSPKTTSPQPASQNSGSKPDKKASTDEDCWDSDN